MSTWSYEYYVKNNYWGKIEQLEIELSSSIAEINDECISKIDAGKPKSSSPPNVEIRQNEGDIDLPQDDVSCLKSEISEKDERKNNLIKEIEKMKAKINLSEGDELKEAIDTVN